MSGHAAGEGRGPRTPGATEAWIALGSNLGDRAGNLHLAIERMGAAVVRVSAVIETQAHGPGPQGPYLNAVAELQWAEGPHALLHRCLAIEREAGRVRGLRWGPRTLDLDVLVVGPGTVEDLDLRVPHPLALERIFVLEPWASLAPDLVVPGTSTTVGAAWALLSRGLGSEQAPGRPLP